MLINRAIFVESTVSPNEIQPFLSKSDLILPSIKRGQLIKLHSNYPSIKEVIIIDGIFEQCPSITHKEILWLLSQNVNVVGIASMGALRAYELRNHGMKGYGWVYEQYLKGHIDGDDEVAVAYDPLDPSNTKTVAMVNLRKTFGNNQDRHILNLAKSIHFKERTWKVLSKHFSSPQLNKIREVYVDAKKQDVLNYIKVKCDSLDVAQINFTPNVYFRKMKVDYSGLTLTEYMRRHINNLDMNNHIHTFQIQDDDFLYVCNFLLLPYSCVPKVASLLHNIHGIKCGLKKVKKFSRMIQKEFKIYCNQDLFNLLKKRDVPLKNANNLFHNLAKIFEMLL